MSRFADFYRQAFDHVYRASMAFCGDSEVAFDATQTSFEKAFVRWRRLRGKPWVEGWVVTVALNECRRMSKGRVPAASPEALNLIVGDPATEPSNDHHIDIVRALQSLPHRQREATVLFYLIDLPIPAVAEAMHLSEGSVRAHLAQARKRLRGALTPSPDSEFSDTGATQKVRKHGPGS